MASSLRKRPCRECRRWFEPDARVGDRQGVCGEQSCQQARRRRNQAEWRKCHPGYFVSWRAKERAEREAPDAPDPPRVGPPLGSLPWDLAQEEFGAVGADFLGAMGRVLLRHAKDQRKAQGCGLTGETPRVPPGGSERPEEGPQG